MPARVKASVVTPVSSWTLPEATGLSLHFDVHICPGGDPLAIVQRAVSTMKRRQQRHGGFWKKAIFLDADGRRENVERTRQADRMIEQSGLLPIWSDPCLEALILRHFPECEHLNPPTSSLARQQLLRRWPDYNKPVPRAALRAKFEIAHVNRAAGTSPQLSRFLREIGFRWAANSETAGVLK